MKTRSMPQGMSVQPVAKTTASSKKVPSKKRAAPTESAVRPAKRQKLQAPSLAITAMGASRKRRLAEDDINSEQPAVRPQRDGKSTAQPAQGMPGSRIYPFPDLSNSIQRRRRLDSQAVQFYYSHATGLKRLTCLITVLLDGTAQEIKFRVPTDDPHQNIIRANFAERRIRGECNPREETSTLTAVVVVREIIAANADDDSFTCRVEAAVGGRVWPASICVEQAWADEALVMAWMSGHEGTGTVRESVEPDPACGALAEAVRFFRTVSVVSRPFEKRSAHQAFRFLVDSWDGEHSMDVEGEIVQSEPVYRGDEKERRLWLKLRLKVQLTREKLVGRYLCVSGDVCSEEWWCGRFRDDAPGQLTVE